MSLDRRRRMIEADHPQLSVVRQCELVSISRSGFHHRPAAETPPDLELMRLIDAQFLETPWYGSRQMARHLRREGYAVGRKRVVRPPRLEGVARRAWHLRPRHQHLRLTIPLPPQSHPEPTATTYSHRSQPKPISSTGWYPLVCLSFARRWSC